MDELVLERMKSGEREAEAFPLALLQAPWLESWLTLGPKVGCGVIFGIGAGVDLIVRCPFELVIDVAEGVEGIGAADHFTLGNWRWHGEILGRALASMRLEFSRRSSFRREAWDVLDAAGLFGVAGIRL